MRRYNLLKPRTSIRGFNIKSSCLVLFNHLPTTELAMKTAAPMKKGMKKIIAILSAVLLFQSNAWCQQERVEIPGSQIRKINSAITHQEYQLYIHLPGNYGSNDKKYPVLYLLDAQWDFPLVSSIYGEQFYDGFIPEMIIVGITWAGKKTNYDSLRARDLTPTHVNRHPQSGGARQFLSFLKKELLPFVDATFKTDTNDRALMGSSLGGLFTLYTLFNETALFNRYVCTSPAITWDNNIIYDYEKKYAAGNKQLAAKLFMAHGGVEQNGKEFEKMVEWLNARNYEGFELRARMIDGIGHSGTKAEGYSRGLQYVFKRPALQLSQYLLDRYIGEYKLPSGEIVQVSSANGLLVAGVKGEQAYTLQAETEKDFYYNGEFLKIRFKTTGVEVNGFELFQFGKTTYLTRVK